MTNVEERYSRQAIFPGIGSGGQAELAKSRVAVLGVGALGSVIANNLARAGVGYIRLIDRDFVELSNLQRQSVFTEADVRDKLPKAIAAARYLQSVNSQIELEPVISDLNAANAEMLLKGVDLVLDGTDNFETRFVLNDACVKNSLPWVHGAVLGSYGLTMNIIPGRTPCYRCMMPGIPETPGETCSSAGVLNMITGIIACYQSAEAVKILINSPAVRTESLFIDVWNHSIQSRRLPVNPDCPACARHDYAFLTARQGTYTTSLCGQNAVQVVPGNSKNINFADLAERLRPLGQVEYNRFTLRFAAGEVGATLFADGRAMIRNVDSENKAKALYAEYFGL